jgi:uncharacterized delta-60 repeat protein
LKGYRGTGGSGRAVLVQSDGKIVAAGEGLHDFVLARYNSDGTLDSSFGTGGKVETLFVANQADSAFALAIQPDGKIVAVGDTGVSSFSGTVFAVARYNTNGTLDTTFGPSHNGLVTTTLLCNDVARAVVIQPDGKIVVAGQTAASSSPLSDGLVRYNTDGTLDTSFGQGGIITLAVVPGASQWFLSVTVETVNVNGVPTTEIVASGNVNSNPQGTVIARFAPNGTLDSSFGSGGTVILQTANPLYKVGGGLMIQADGKILDVGFAQNPQGATDSALGRFNVDGSLDTSFNPSGPTPGLLDLGIAGIGRSLALQSDGKIIVGGSGSASTLLLARLNGADGSFDTTFGTNGVVQQTLTGSPFAASIALQPDGKIVTLGTASGSGSAVNYFAVARFLGDTTTPSAPASAVSLTSTSGPSSLSASRSLSNPVAPSTAVFDQALAMAALDPASGLTALVATLGDVGLSPARPRVRWSPQAHRFGQS